MPRANRYFLPGHVWHITHRCHKKEFLLKFAKDRKRWLHWLFDLEGTLPFIPSLFLQSKRLLTITSSRSS